MCGQFQISWDDGDSAVERLRELIKKKHPDKQAPSGDIFPGTMAPLLVADGERASAELMSWGIKLPGSSRPVINARAETAPVKPMFKAAVREGRCIVPTTGFYEWSHDAKKQKYLFRLPNSVSLFLAGLYTPEGFVVITTEANASVADIHDRMPLIIGARELPLWLGDESWALSALRRPSPALERIPC